jgi:hypothetical protein
MALAFGLYIFILSLSHYLPFPSSLSSSTRGAGLKASSAHHQQYIIQQIKLSVIS